MGHATSFIASEWKDRDSPENTSTGQGLLPLIGEAPPLGVADGSFIARCSWEGACRYAVQRSGNDDFEIADAVGISHGYMSKVLKGTAGLWGRRLARFMLQTRCIAPLQWLADQVGCDVVPRDARSARIAQLEAELSAVRRTA